MTPKVRRGLGLLVLAVLLLIADALFFTLGSWITDPGGVPDWLGYPILLLAVVAALGALVAFFAGLVSLVMGLLRSDPA